MDIQTGQTWSIPPHGQEIYVHAATEAEVSYSTLGLNGPTHTKARPVFEASMLRLGAKVLAE